MPLQVLVRSTIPNVHKTQLTSMLAKLGRVAQIWGITRSPIAYAVVYLDLRPVVLETKLAEHVVN